MSKVKTILPLLILAALLALSFFHTDTALAANHEGFELSAPAIPNPFDYLPNDLFKEAANKQNISTVVPAFPKLPGFKELVKGTSGGDLGKLVNTDAFSSKDLTGSIKAIIALAINLFLIVIQTVVGVLKALLPLLS